MSNEHQVVREYIHQTFEGVYDEAMVDQHIETYVKCDQSRELLRTVNMAGKPDRLLDIGCGFGSFICVCREAGIDARGIDLSTFEIDFARNRLDPDACHPIVPDQVFMSGDAQKLPFDKGVFDVITMWNFLEHVPALDAVIQEAARVLRSGGRLYITCPNYCSFRREAHYQVPWVPMLPRRLAVLYLKFLGKNPKFFQEAIVYRYPWQVLRALRHAGMEAHDWRTAKLANMANMMDPAKRRIIELMRRLGLGWILELYLAWLLRNPLNKSINWFALKKAKPHE